MGDTKTRILDAAETLFAEQGFTATSVRQLTASAGVNLASLHSHFGSKDGLIEALFERRLQPLNRERLALLDALEKRHRGGPIPLPSLVEAFVGPPLRLSSASSEGGERFMRLMGRAFSEPEQHVAQIFLSQFKELAQRFIPAFLRSLPHLDEEEVHWRIHFMVGSMAHTMAHASRVSQLLERCCVPQDPEQLLARLVPFLVAGLESPRPAGVEEAVP